MNTSRIVVLLAVAMNAAEPPEAMERARASYERAKQGDLSGAAEQMRIAIKLAPENPLYLSALSGIAGRQWESGRLMEARENVAMIVGAQPDNPKALEMLEEISLDLGAELAKQRRFKAGLTLAQDTAKKFPSSARAQQMLGLFLTRNQQNPAAIAAYRKALSLSPESSDLNVGLGMAQTMAGLLPDAVKTLEAGIQRWPAEAMHYQALGVLLLRMSEEGADTEARGAQMLRKALELDSGVSEAHYQLGNLALKHDEPKQAVDHLLMALRNGDQSSKVHFALARAYRAAGNSTDSEKHSVLFREQKQREQQSEAKQ